MPNISPVFLPGSITIEASKNVKITNLSAPLANTEYSLLLQVKLKQLKIKARVGAKLQYAFVAGDSSIAFNTIPKFCEEVLVDLDFTGKTLYIQSDTVSTIIEIVELY